MDHARMHFVIRIAMWKVMVVPEYCDGFWGY